MKPIPKNSAQDTVLRQNLGSHTEQLEDGLIQAVTQLAYLIQAEKLQDTMNYLKNP